MGSTNGDVLVGLVIVSHSASIADGVAELVAQVAGPDVAIITAGGGPARTRGTGGGRGPRALPAARTTARAGAAAPPRRPLPPPRATPPPPARAATPRPARPRR